MKNFFFKNIFRSIKYYRKDAVYQIIIVAILTAVITGSLLTGESVRNSLKKTSEEKLGNTDIVISSGLRYFDPALTAGVEERTGNKAAAILEIDGYCQNFSTGQTALNTKIFAVDNDFFAFNSGDTITIEKGTVAVNKRLADFLNVNPGDEIIIRFRSVDPIPANAPFAPKTENQGSKVMKVSRILLPEQSGNFSLGVSQAVPMNVFMNIREERGVNENVKPNRLLIDNTNGLPLSAFTNLLPGILTLQDIGLSIRRSAKTGEPELISERIFIDSALAATVINKIPSSCPVLTYLANEISCNGQSTPYSFVTAILSQVTRGLVDDEIIINQWVAEDIGSGTGDTVKLTWFVQGFRGKLEERTSDFRIAGIQENDGANSDPSLMPDFPGISGRTSCSDWDAGIPVLLERIRGKDEDYWNKYKGTPKAFINYESGKKLWSNNFGVATAVRFPQEMEEEEIEKILNGSIDPGSAGFSITDLRNSAMDAAEAGTDFGSLFISLSLFIIVSCIILLSLSVSIYFDTRRKQIRAMSSLGFRSQYLRRMLFTEASLLSLLGAIPGVFLGYLMNVLIINALNGVWKGAVQTDTLLAGLSIMSLIYGLLITLFITFILIYFKSSSFTSLLFKRETGELKTHSYKGNLLILSLLLLIYLVILGIALFSYQLSTALYFIAGALLLIIMVLLLRSYYIKEKGKSRKEKVNSTSHFSKRYYFFNPAQAIIPVVVLAAGIFAIVITSANRQVITSRSLLPSGGTGGYLLWAESAIPIKQDLAGEEGRRELGLHEDELRDLEVLQASRLAGDDASCLNLNHVTSPPVLGVDPANFIRRGSFSFASTLKEHSGANPWELLGTHAGENTIYAIADQTVLEWGLKLKTGDTIVIKAEDGQPLNMVICAGLRSSVFQGQMIIHDNDMARYFPSVSGNSVFLFDGNPVLSDRYRELLNERFYGYGFQTMDAGSKLASFMEVTNTYLDVFTILGIFGMVLGVAGLGFILLRNFNQRKREFALMAATGFSQRKIRDHILRDQILILAWGLLTGTLSGLVATIPSISSGSEIPWTTILIMILLVALTGLITLLLSVRNVRNAVLISELRRE
jgi:ABC-type antimicrobial peptide transport system permease subunit